MYYYVCIIIIIIILKEKHNYLLYKIIRTGVFLPHHSHAVVPQILFFKNKLSFLRIS